jgi:hypothetical protein
LRGNTLDRVIAFHTNLGIPNRSSSIRKEDVWYRLYQFADPDHVKLCRVMLGGTERPIKNRRLDDAVSNWRPLLGKKLRREFSLWCA